MISTHSNGQEKEWKIDISNIEERKKKLSRSTTGPPAHTTLASYITWSIDPHFSLSIVVQYDSMPLAWKWRHIDGQHSTIVHLYYKKWKKELNKDNFFRQPPLKKKEDKDMYYNSERIKCELTNRSSAIHRLLCHTSAQSLSTLNYATLSRWETEVFSSPNEKYHFQELAIIPFLDCIRCFVSISSLSLSLCLLL